MLKKPRSGLKNTAMTVFYGKRQRPLMNKSDGIYWGFPNKIDLRFDSDFVQSSHAGWVVLVSNAQSRSAGLYADCCLGGTLYGHLSRECLQQLETGQIVSGGTTLAEIGNSNENGGWLPHVHFQLILDLFDFDGNYPGVALPSRKKVWSQSGQGFDFGRKRNISFEVLVQKTLYTPLKKPCSVLLLAISVQNVI